MVYAYAGLEGDGNVWEYESEWRLTTDQAHHYTLHY